MKRKMYKVIALLMTLAMLAGLALSEEAQQILDGDLLDLSMQQSESELEIDGEAVPGGESTETLPKGLDNVDLNLGSLDPMSEVTYRFIVDGTEYASQKAQAGETILRPADPEAPNGKVFTGWVLADGASLFADANEDGEIDPVIVQDYELGTEVYVWAQFIDPEEARQPAEAQFTEEAPVTEESVEEAPTEEETSEEETTEEETSEEETSEEAPVAEEPTEVEPAEETPAEEPPVEEAPAEEVPAEETPAEEPPAEEAPAEEAPVEEAPAEEAPAEEAPAEEAPAEEAPAEEAPVEEAPAEEAPVEEAPVEEAPAEEAPVAEEPVEELQPAVEEQPAEETQVQSAEEAQPVANSLTYTGEAQPLVSVEGAWLYSLDGETYSEAVPTAVNAGEYTVYFKAAEGDEPRAITVTVAKADAVFTPPVAAVGE